MFLYWIGSKYNLLDNEWVSMSSWNGTEQYESQQHWNRSNIQIIDWVWCMARVTWESKQHIRNDYRNWRKSRQGRSYWLSSAVQINVDHWEIIGWCCLCRFQSTSTRWILHESVYRISGPSPATFSFPLFSFDYNWLYYLSVNW